MDFENETYYDSETDTDTYYDSSDGEFYEKEEIILQPHQKNVIKYIVSKCKKQHGLLLNHYQGTGKTITGIFFLKNFDKYKKVIIGPDVLQNMWKKSAKDNGLNNNVFYISYSQLEKSVLVENGKFENEELYRKIKNILQDCILICDEAHNILDFCNNYQSESSQIVKINEVKKKKILLFLT